MGKCVQTLAIYIFGSIVLMKVGSVKYQFWEKWWLPHWIVEFVSFQSLSRRVGEKAVPQKTFDLYLNCKIVYYHTVY